MSLRLSLLSLPLLFALTPCSTLESLDQDPILGAIQAECQRAKDSLRSPNGQKPYLVRATLHRLERTNWFASLGRLESKNIDTIYELRVDVRIGTPEFDQSQFYDVNLSDQAQFAQFPPSGDPLLIRKAIWSGLDREFKAALEILPQKKAWVQDHPEKKLPKSWPSPPAFANFEDLSYPIGDTSLISKKITELSSSLEPKVEALESRAKYEYVKTTTWYYDTDNRKSKQIQSENTLVAALLTQAYDGTPLWDYLRHSDPDAKQVLQNDWNIEAKDIRNRINTLKAIPPLSHYRGPVIFSGEAAGEFWQAVLMDQISRVPNTHDISQSPHPIVNLLGQRLLPKGIDIKITPSVKKWNSKEIYHSFNYDQEGVLAEEGDLVRDGRLVKLPRKLCAYAGQKDSTLGGHFFFGSFFPGVTQISSREGLVQDEFNKNLRILAQDEGISEILQVRKIYDSDAIGLLSHPLTSAAYESTQMELYNPVDGSHRPVRGIVFSEYSLRDLRYLQSFSKELYLKENHGVQSLIYPERMILGLDDLQPRNETPPLSLLP